MLKRINILKTNPIWFFNTGEQFQVEESTLEVESEQLTQPVYLIAGNKNVKQKKPSKSLLNISGITKLHIQSHLHYENIEVSLVIQLFNSESLVSSTSYTLSEGKNKIDIPPLHPSIIFLKPLFKITPKASTEKRNLYIKKFKLSIETYHPPLESSNMKSLIPNVEHFHLTERSTFTHKEGTYAIRHNDTLFHFYLNRNTSNPKLLIALPGATDRKKPFYNFQRYSWSHNMDCSFMSFLDPTITPNNTLNIGWFQGNQATFALEKLTQLLKKIFKENSIIEKEVIFFGSSAGGFSALKLANHFPEAQIIAINPQIYLFNYMKKPFEKMLHYVFPETAKKEVLEHYRERLEIDIDFNARKAPIFYYQNIADLHHVKKHLEPYLERLTTNDFQAFVPSNTIKELKKLNILLYEDSKHGHSPPNKETTLNIIDNVANNRYKGSQWIL